MAQRLQPVGTIEIKLFRQNYGQKGGPTEIFSTRDGFLGKGGIEAPEKALKGETKSHGATFVLPFFCYRFPFPHCDSLEKVERHVKGISADLMNSLDAPQKVVRGPVWRTKKIDGEDYPIAIFRFMYRSEGILPFPVLSSFRLFPNN